MDFYAHRHYANIHKNQNFPKSESVKINESFLQRYLLEMLLPQLF